MSDEQEPGTGHPEADDQEPETPQAAEEAVGRADGESEESAADGLGGRDVAEGDLADDDVLIADEPDGKKSRRKRESAKRRSAGGRRRRRGRRMTPRRWLPVLVFAVLVAAAVVVNRSDDEVERPTVPVDRAGVVMPVAAGPRALSTAFFCSGGTATGKRGEAELAVLIANGSRKGTKADITFVTIAGRTRKVSVDVPAAGRVRVAAADHVEGDWVAATVDVLGPDVVVEKTVNGRDGFELGPCPTTASDRWYVASGSTAIGAKERLVLYNPFPAPSSVDISFSTEDGRLTPRALRGFTIPAGSLRVVDTDLMPARKAEIAATVVARTGKIVVDRVQSYDGTGAAIPADGDAAAVSAPIGLASASGTSSPSTRWVFPDVVSAEGTRTQIALFNPTSRTAEIDLVLSYEDPRRRAAIEPVQVTLPGMEERLVDLRSVPGLELGQPFMLRVESLAIDGDPAVPVVAEQVVLNAPSAAPGATEGRGGEGVGEEAGGPSAGGLVDGFSVTVGSPVMAPTWYLTTAGASPSRSASAVVANVGDEAAAVRIETVLNGSRTRLPKVLRVPAGDRRTIDLEDVDPSAAIVVSSSVPVVVSRTVVASSGSGVSYSIAAPIPAGVRTLPPAD
ncbi:MAG: hypothetical protein KDB02_14565 [Acidimicrobiales bacterium]|nr:hypothetical protein [Acidimicrobiales bacterium]